MKRRSLNKALIVGTGSIARRHFDVLQREAPSIEICVLKHRTSLFKGKPANKTLEVDNVDEAVSFSPDFAIIANPAPFHIDSAGYFAQEGCHLLIEKPLSNSSDGLAQLSSTCENKNVVVHIGYVLRHLPSIQKFKEALQDKSIGKLIAVKIETGQYLRDWRPNSNLEKTVSFRKSLGGGVLRELSHELDLVHYLFGRPKKVAGELRRLTDLTLDCEDAAKLKVEIDSGLIIDVDLDFIRRDATRKCYVIAENASLLWDATKGHLMKYHCTNQEWETIYKKSEVSEIATAYDVQMSDFLDKADNPKYSSVSATLYDGGLVVKMIEGIEESNKAGTSWVELQVDND